MLYGIIADVHGNLEAFNTVLSRLQRADKVVCLGDIVGYGPDPNACVEKVRDLGIPSVAGNHDKAVTGELEVTWFSPSAREAVRWTREVISQENLEFLRNLPEVLEEDGFQLAHGSLRSPLEEYITSISEALGTFEKMSKEVCFVGHSHVPLFIGRRKDGNYGGRALHDGEEVVVSDYDKVIINVGGVGQPRDGDPRASYGVFNPRTGLFGLHRVEYNIGRVQEKMKKAGLPEPLIERLAFGR